MENPVCEVYVPGRMEYGKAWALQNSLAGEIASGMRPPTLLLLEHPHTYTVGRRGGREHLLWDEDRRREKGVTLFDVDRGGDITYHGPGQVVGYPLLRLAQPGWQAADSPQVDFVGYVRKLEGLIINILSSFSLPAVQRSGLTGVWIAQETVQRHQKANPRLRSASGKIASIGVKVDSKGVSRHGFALNVDPISEYWEGIIPCGLDGVQMVSLADFVQPVPSAEEILQSVISEFEKVFGYRCLIKSASDLEEIRL